MTFLNETEKIKAEIKMLQKKLDFLEELSQTKPPVEEAFKRVYNVYPSSSEKSVFWTDNDEDTWIAFQKGYNAAQKDYKVGEHQEPEPKEPKTLYQIIYDKGWRESHCNEFCDIVKEWIYQYDCDYATCKEYLEGYEECQTVLEERLK